MVFRCLYSRVSRASSSAYMLLASLACVGSKMVFLQLPAAPKNIGTTEDRESVRGYEFVFYPYVASVQGQSFMVSWYLRRANGG